MSSQIDQLRANFNMMNTTQKAQFINNLRHHLQGVMNEEYSNFLNECVAQYNLEVRAEPVVPVVPVMQAEPSAPVTPNEPVVTAAPVQPVVPTEPVTPVQPFVPVEPVVTTAPVQPFAPIPQFPNQPYAPNQPYVHTAQQFVPPAKPTAPGRMFLKVVGILYIIFAGISILVSLSGLASSDYWDIFLPLDFIPWSLYYAIALLHGGWLLFVGITGLRHCVNLSKGKLLLKLGIAAIVVDALFIAWVIVIGYAGAATFTFIGLALPILYVIGASKNKQAFETQTQTQGQEPPPHQPGGFPPQ